MEVAYFDPQSDSDYHYSNILTKRMYHMNCVTRDSVRIKCQFNLVNRKVEFFHCDEAIMGRRKNSKSKYTLSKFTELKYTPFKWHALVLIICVIFIKFQKQIVI